MDFRLAQKPDLNQLARMRWEYWIEGGSDPAKQDKQEFVDTFVETFKPIINKDWYIWCAVESRSILSHVYMQRIAKVPKPSAPVDAFGYVTNVYTRPAHRNKGIGAQVMEHAKVWAQELDLEFLVLWPSEASTPFWRKVDFSADKPYVHKVRPYIY